MIDAAAHEQAQDGVRLGGAPLLIRLRLTFGSWPATHFVFTRTRNSSLMLTIEPIGEALLGRYGAT
jgi:hypothetical protein